MTVEGHYFPENGRTFHFWKGRVGLYAILRALEVGPGDQVIMPGFTCVVVPNAVLYLGAIPVYADIDPATYNLRAETIEPLITDRTKVILAQNTFGLSADLDPIMDLAESHGLYVIEDCAHGLGGFYRGQRNGTVAHAAFFSTQWSKPISTGLGGIVYTRDRDISRGIETFVNQIPTPGFGEQAMLYAQLVLRPLADHPWLYYPLVGLYRLLTRKLGLSVGSNSGGELTTQQMPAGYAKRMTAIQLKKWCRELSKIDQMVQERHRAAAFYDEFLSAIGIQPPYRPPYAVHGMLRYTIRVPDRDRLLENARDRHIPVGDWFISPLYPVTAHLERWGYRVGQCPIAERACQEVINLLTDRPLSERQLGTLFQDHL
jgi:dTDP-4-amino-4,6-dideoxygalactose transaminase